MAEDLIADIRRLDEQLTANAAKMTALRDDGDAIGTTESWQDSAEFTGGEFTDDDWLALVQALARQAAGQNGTD